APDHLVLALGECTSALFGTVRDASGGPIANARVGLALAGHGVPGGPAVVTSATGAYELCAETSWPGWLGVEVSADGYAAITVHTIVPGRMKLDFALVPEAIVVGHVIRDDTRAPVPNAYVFVPAGRG